jgi:hypothetical protein
MPAELPLDAALARLTPQAPERSGFLGLTAEVAEALAPFAETIGFRQLGYDAAEGGLALTIEAPDLASLQEVEADLGAAGLAVTAGVATTGDGAAEVRYLVRDLAR